MIATTRPVIVPAHVIPLWPDGVGWVIEWRLAPGEIGEWQSYVQFPRRTVTVSGTPDALIVLEGSNDAEDDTDVHLLHDTQGWEIAHPGIYELREVPRWIRARGQVGEAHVRVCATGGR